VSSDDRYPLCTAALARLMSGSGSVLPSSIAAFRVGPGVLRAPAPVARRSGRAASDDDDNYDDNDDNDASGERDTRALLGELTDMLLVGADDADSGLPEVHLQFKSDVVGGLHLRLVKKPEGLSAVFMVKDAATRREVAAHVDALVAHLRERGFSVLEARLEVSG
jgi:hypothetical protein